MTIYAFLQFEKSTIRREFKHKMVAEINEDELVLLKFTKQETQTKLRWEHSKEFEYNGQMYDIVSKKVKGDSIFYRCWWDFEETALNKKLTKMVAFALNNDEDSRDAQQNLYNYLWSFFCSDILYWQPNPSGYNYIVYNNNYLKVFNSIRLLPPTPPPKLS